MCKFGFIGPDMRDIIESQYEGTHDSSVESLWNIAEEYNEIDDLDWSDEDDR